MSAHTTGDGWTAAVELNLDTAGASAFQETMTKFYEWSKTQPPLGPIGMQNGWHEITPQIAEDMLRRNSANRKVSLQAVKKYYNVMKIGGWRRTGQPMIVNREGKAEDLQHRAWASYLGKVSFTSYVITDVPAEPDMFAYIDDGKPRSAADALYTSGNNGLSGIIAGAVKLAWRYDNNAIGIFKQPRIRDMSTPEVLDYARNNETLGAAAHLLMGSYPKAANVIGNKAVATFFTWKATEYHGSNVVDDFMIPLGSGANLDEDSPILALRNRLLRDSDGDDNDLKQPHRLALVIKAFNFFVAGTKMGKRRTLSLRDDEKYPRIETTTQLDLPQAAE